LLQLQLLKPTNRPASYERNGNLFWGRDRTISEGRRIPQRVSHRGNKKIPSLRLDRLPMLFPKAYQNKATLPLWAAKYAIKSNVEYPVLRVFFFELKKK
jgi:hypothetical protein